MENKNRCGSVGDVAAKKVTKEYGCNKMKQKRRMQVAGLHPFYIPDNVPENRELTTPFAQSAVVDTRTENEKDWDFVMKTKASEISLGAATTSTDATLVEPYHKSGSVVSVASTDMYGWEENLSRKTSLEQGVLLHANTMPVADKPIHDEIKPVVKADTMPSPPKHTSRTKGLLYKVLHPSSGPITS